jgi:hypothetical protein
MHFGESGLGGGRRILLLASASLLPRAFTVRSESPGRSGLPHIYGGGFQQDSVAHHSALFVHDGQAGHGR